MHKVLTIAGSDSSGGAGIQADIKTITAHRMYAMSAITALTAQNTTGVYGILDSGAEFTALQIDCIFKDIRPDAVKIGMVSNAETIAVIADKLTEYKAENIVVDPVMVATSGSNLMKDGSVQALVERLFPLASVITPNIPEAEILSGIKINSADDMISAAKKIVPQTSGAVLIKGGHLTDTADDLLYIDGRAEWFSAPRVDNPNNHGTGCTLSSAIACNLAAGCCISESVKNAKKYITDALNAGLDLGHGSGPLNHMHNL